MFAPATHHIVPLAQLLQQHWDIRGVILQVGIHEHDDITQRVLDAGGHGSGLPEITAEGDHPHLARVLDSHLFQQCQAAICTAIINQYHFPGDRQPLQRLL